MVTIRLFPYQLPDKYPLDNMEHKTQNMEHARPNPARQCHSGGDRSRPVGRGTWNIRKGEKSTHPSSVACSMLRIPCSRGFTLVEMLVSIALFSFVMLATTSVLLSVVDANRKAQGLKSSIDNLSLALDSMSRNLRTGSGYPSGDNSSSCLTRITFLDQYGKTVTYSHEGTSINVSKSSGLSGPLTAPEITVNNLCFYVDGTQVNDKIQPRILITARGEVSRTTAQGAKNRTRSNFDIQTFVSQRLMDVPNN